MSKENCCRPHDFKVYQTDYTGEPNYQCSKCEIIVSGWEKTWYQRGIEHSKDIEEKKRFIELEEYLEEYLGEGALKADGFDEAIVGVVSRCGFNPVVCYSQQKIIQILMDRDGMDYEEAQEYYSFNISGAYVGEGTPMFLEY